MSTVRMRIKGSQHSVTVGPNKVYRKGQVYEIPEEVWSSTLKPTGLFEEAAVAPPDPNEPKKERVANLINRLAGLSDESIERFEKLLEASAVAPPAPSPAPEETEDAPTEATEGAATEDAGGRRRRR